MAVTVPLNISRKQRKPGDQQELKRSHLTFMDHLDYLRPNWPMKDRGLDRKSPTRTRTKCGGLCPSERERALAVLGNQADDLWVRYALLQPRRSYLLGMPTC